MASVVRDGELTVEDAASILVTPSAYADPTLYDAACSVLRREAPVHLVERDGYPSFWSITKHADVFEISKSNEHFFNAPRPVLFTLEREKELLQRQGTPKALIHLDGHEHKALRGLTLDWFTPHSLSHMDCRLAELAKRSVDTMQAAGGECDFASDIAQPLPLQVILSILGLPEEDYPKMFALTQELTGVDDPEYARNQSPEAFQEIFADFFLYFVELIEKRQSNPTDDLASVIANATVDDEPLGIIEQLWYYVIIAVAGHDTTAAAISGGIQALIEHPDQLRRLKDDPSLYAPAAEEIIRWVSPLKHFMRNVVAPYGVRGHQFEPDDCVMLCYPSANRDEDAFADPFKFDVGRKPNRHLGFGFGAHFCLGATLARLEIRALLAELIPRLESIELNGEPELRHTLFVGGHKRLPIRYQLSS